jgi:hypothetical protein
VRKKNIIKQAVIDRTNYEEIILIQDGIERLTEKQRGIVNVCKETINYSLLSLKKILGLEN